MKRLILCAAIGALALVPAGCGDDDQGGVGRLDGSGGGDTQDTADTGPTSATDASATADGDAAVTTDATAAPTDTAATGVTDTTTTTPPGDTSVGFCRPNERSCVSVLAYRQCNAAGTDFGPEVACAEDETCREGTCVVRCPNDPKFGSYVGCEFWATDLPNYPDPTTNPTPENLPWALVVSNPGQFAVRVGFEMPPLFTFSPADDVVQPGDSRVFELPNINVEGTSLRPKGVHLTATGPVLAHQFNPWDNKFSNDASLLLPDPLLGTDYVILSWPTAPLDQVTIPGFPTPTNQNGYFTIIAAYDDTEVTVQVTANVRAAGAIPAMQPGQVQTFRLNRGDVLSIQSDPDSLFDKGDISGSTVSATRPVSVFGGHEEAVIGDPVEDENGGKSGPCCADHLEEAMLPLEILADAYYAIKSPPRGTTEIEPDIWRIQAAEPGVVIQTSPPQPGAHDVTLAKRGDFVEVKTSASFEVTATGKIQVGQYLVGQQATQRFTGDPSLLLMIPSERYRRDYIISVPSSYTQLWLAITRPIGAAVSLDGTPIDGSGFTALGATGMEYGYVLTTPGVHELSSTERFGLSVYGWNNAVSFSFAGGLAGPNE